MHSTVPMKARDIAPGRWPLILADVGIDPAFLDKKEGPCPMCGGSTRFFFDNKDQKGTFCCRYCGAGDGFKLMQLFGNMDFAQAARWIEDWYGGQSVEVRTRVVPRPVESDGLTPEKIILNKAKHKTLWEASHPVVEGDPVWKYLHNRIPGFNRGMLSNMIRIHPNLPYYQTTAGVTKKLGHHPAMISMILAPDGSCQDIHRTYLTENGEKAPYDDVKKTLATIGVKGGAIRLVKPIGNVLAVAEGIETAYAVMLFKNLPCWATVNTSGMKNFIVPEGIKYLYIFADNDLPNRYGVRAGFDAAQKLKKSSIERGSS
ncbi:primase-helicase zinc-binding domain-containing protein [Undibacterium arcticum]|uniref:DUF7146 domain-containing protein n=1 Tax=Undibacterium arcticum TaxID=1762892 RepID=UPI00360D43DC